MCGINQGGVERRDKELGVARLSATQVFGLSSGAEPRQRRKNEGGRIDLRLAIHRIPRLKPPLGIWLGGTFDATT